jgi:hypothetical protein
MEQKTLMHESPAMTACVTRTVRRSGMEGCMPSTSSWVFLRQARSGGHGLERTFGSRGLDQALLKRHSLQEG